MTVTGSGQIIRNRHGGTGTDCLNSVDDLHWQAPGSPVFATILTPVLEGEALVLFVWISGPVYFGSDYFETLFFNDEVVEGVQVSTFIPDDPGDPDLHWPFIFWGRTFQMAGDYPARVFHAGPTGDGGIFGLHVPAGCYREQTSLGG